MVFKKDVTLFDKAILYVIPFTIVLSVVLLLITGNKNAEVKSLIVGAASAVILNFWHTRMTLKIMKENPKMIKRFTIFSYFFRYTVYGALMLIGIFLSDFNAIYITFGICEYPLMVTILSLLLIKKD